MHLFGLPCSHRPRGARVHQVRGFIQRVPSPGKCFLFTFILSNKTIKATGINTHDGEKKYLFIFKYILTHRWLLGKNK